MEYLRSLPLDKQAYMVLFAATWLIGANVVVALHYKRMGKSIWSGFKPFAFPFRDFNRTEWGLLAVLAVIALTFGSMAIG